MVPVGFAGEATTRPASGRLGVGGVQQVEGRLEALRGTAVEFDDLAAKRGQDVPVGRVARPGERDAVSWIEGGQEGQQEGARRAGGEADLGRVDRKPVPALVVTGDLLTQRTDAEGLGIAESGVVGHQLGRATPHVRRRAL